MTHPTEENKPLASTDKELAARLRELLSSAGEVASALAERGYDVSIIAKQPHDNQWVFRTTMSKSVFL